MQQRRYTVSVEPRGKFWYGRVYLEGEGGKGRKFSTGVLIGSDRRVSKREATRVAEGRADNIARQASLPVATDDHALDSVAERMLRHKAASKRRERAVDALAFNLDKHVIPFFGRDRDVRTIRRRDLEAFKVKLSEADYAPTSVNNALTAIRQTLKYACEVEELLEAIPLVHNVEVPKESTVAKPITPAQAADYLAAFKEDEQEEREFNLFLLNTGLRKEEALAIRWDWVNLEAREIRIPAAVRKGGKPQKAPTQINNVVYELLCARRGRTRRTKQGRELAPSKGRVWFQLGTYDDARQRAATKAGIEGFRHHDARHTRATLLAANGATAIDLRDQMGWSTLAMVNRYTHPEHERMQEMASRVQLGVGRVGRVSGTGCEGSRGEDRGTSENTPPALPVEKRKKFKAL
jgi:integrase